MRVNLGRSQFVSPSRDDRVQPGVSAPPGCPCWTSSNTAASERENARESSRLLVRHGEADEQNENSEYRASDRAVYPGMADAADESGNRPCDTTDHRAETGW